MKYTISIDIPGGTIQLEADSQKQVFDELSFWQSLPKFCPVDGSDVRLNVRDTAKGVYYEIVSTGSPIFRGHVGQNREGGTLFYKDDWSHWTGEKEIVVRSNGINTPALDALLGKVAPKQPAPQQAPAPQPKVFLPEVVPTPTPTPTSAPQQPAHRSTQQPKSENTFSDSTVGATTPQERLNNCLKMTFKDGSDRVGGWIASVFSEGSTLNISALADEEAQAAIEYVNAKPDELKLRYAIWLAYPAQYMNFERWYADFFCKRTNVESRPLSKITAAEHKVMLDRFNTHGDKLDAAFMASLEPVGVGK